jgi:hypothetical protein
MGVSQPPFFATPYMKSDDGHCRRWFVWNYTTQEKSFNDYSSKDSFAITVKNASLCAKITGIFSGLDRRITIAQNGNFFQVTLTISELLQC